MKRRTNSKQSLRRGTAGLLALVGLGMTVGGASPDTLETLAGLDSLSAALSLQTTQGDEPLPLMQRLLLGESALLSQWAAGDTAVQPPTADTPDPNHEDAAEEEPLESATPDKVEARTLTGSGSNYISYQGSSVYNRTEKTLDLASIIQGGSSLSFESAEAGPQILIMHTHTTEAYAQDEANPYQESGTARTTDPTYNIIRVGDEVTRIFEEMGLNVLHDTTLYDYPSYNEAYERSRAGVEAILAEHPTIQVVLDIHRDALVGSDGTIYKPLLTVDGVPTAQVMLLCGSDDAGATFPDWPEHLALAMNIQNQINALWPGLARPTTLRTARFNQQLTKGSLLVEIGSHGNTLEEALAGARIFARSAGKVFLERVQG